ncbi:MAG: hypothetical protein EOP61_10835 [Sphingomonadales bacterium]|nr:MAG: hypothetical protein EOP61_10835 [Sphingomonadales bacterium]
MNAARRLARLQAMVQQGDDYRPLYLVTAAYGTPRVEINRRFAEKYPDVAFGPQHRRMVVLFCDPSKGQPGSAATS